MDKEKLKKICKKLIFLPLPIIILLALVAAPALALVFVYGIDTHPIAYFVYVFSFYTLSVATVYCVLVLPKQYKRAKGAIYGTKYGNMFFTDLDFRTHITLYSSLILNVLYAVFNVLSGIVYNTAWFHVLAGYYIILALMRFLLSRFVSGNDIGENTVGEWRRSRVCAFILTLINLSLSGAILMIMYQKRGFVYHGMLIYVMAAYTFYITTVAIINIVRYRKYNSPVLTMSKIINLTAALVSMLQLETAMLSTFGADMTEETKRLFIALTGAGISVIVIAMSVYMIVRSTIEIKKAKTEK